MSIFKSKKQRTALDCIEEEVKNARTEKELKIAWDMLKRVNDGNSDVRLYTRITTIKMLIEDKYKKLKN